MQHVGQHGVPEIIRHQNDVIAWLLTSTVAFSFAAAPAAAAEVQIQACLTIVDSLYRDHRATTELFRRYGPQSEFNPIVRVTGPDLYFLILYGLTASKCTNGSSQWQLTSLAVWAVQTWAVNTHLPFGTAIAGMPLLHVSIHW